MKTYKILIILFFLKGHFQVCSQIKISDAGPVLVNGGETFYDAGGAGSDDGNNDQTITLCPKISGERVYVDFTNFSTSFDGILSNSDYLYIFDGNSITSPNIGRLGGDYSGKYNTATTPFKVGAPFPTDVIYSNPIDPNYSNAFSPGIFSATNVSGCLTFNFVNKNSNTSSGWTAIINTYKPLDTPGCEIDITADQTNICSSTQIKLKATGKLSSEGLKNDFNSGIGSWNGTVGATLVTSFCGASSLDGSQFIWMKDWQESSTKSRSLETNSINVSNGGLISFEYCQAPDNKGATSCDAPDRNSTYKTLEGIYLQYSINNGVNWTTIKYIFPNGQTGPMGKEDGLNGCGDYVKKWTKMIYPIPSAAKTTNTKFRWIQPIITGPKDDNWGIDNVIIATQKPITISIYKNPVDATNHGTLISSSSPYEINETPSANTTYRAVITDGTSSCYKDIPIIVNSCCTPPTVTPTPTNPTCTGNDGKIELTGLANSTAYSVTYKKNGTAVAAASFTSDATGKITISGLSGGNFTDIICSIGTCATAAVTTALTDLIQVTFTTSKQDPSSCGASDGEIKISGLSASTAYEVSYKNPGGTSVGPTAITSSASNEIVLSTLIQGSYTDLKVKLVSSGCFKTDAGPIVLADPSGITFTPSKKKDPTTCGASDGEIKLAGLSASTAYEVSYKKPDGTVVGPTPITSNATNEIIIDQLIQGSYSAFTVKLVSNSCSKTEAGPVVLSDPSGITFTATKKQDPTTCVATDGIIELKTLTANTDYEVSYKDPLSTLVGPITKRSDINGILSIDALAEGSYSDFTVKASSGCSKTIITPVVLTKPAVITFAVSKNLDPTCGGNDGKINITGLIATKNYTLTYTPPSGTAVGPSPFTADASGNYTIPSLGKGSYSNFIVKNTTCSETVNTPISLTEPNGPSKPTATVIHPKCGIPTGSIEIITPVGSNLSYCKDGGTFQSTKLFSSLTANSNYTITVKNNTTQCSTDSIFKIDTILMIPNTASSSLKHASCILATGAINVTAPLGSFFTYSIDNGNNFQPTPSFPNLTPGNYTITTKTGSGCTSTANVTIKTPPAPPVKPIAVVTQPTCTVATGTITVTNPLGINYSYSLDNITFQASASFDMQTAGSYTYYVKDTTECYAFNTSTVQAPPILPIASFNYAPVELSTLSSEAVFTNNSINATSFKWVFDDGSKISNVKNPTHLFPGNANDYNVKLTAFNKLCSHDTTVLVTVIEKPIIYVPNSFTPNEDELNNVFVPVIGGGIASENYSMYIFNRWGNLMFESHNKEIGWDGTFGNKPCTADTYIWKIEYRESSGTKSRKQLVGHFNLVN